MLRSSSCRVIRASNVLATPRYEDWKARIVGKWSGGGGIFGSTNGGRKFEEERREREEEREEGKVRGLGRVCPFL